MFNNLKWNDLFTVLLMAAMFYAGVAISGGDLAGTPVIDFLACALLAFSIYMPVHLVLEDEKRRGLI